MANANFYQLLQVFKLFFAATFSSVNNFQSGPSQALKLVDGSYTIDAKQPLKKETENNQI